LLADIKASNWFLFPIALWLLSQGLLVVILLPKEFPLFEDFTSFGFLSVNP